MKALSKKVRHAATVLAISSLTFSFNGGVIANEPALHQAETSSIKKIKDVVVYEDANFYCAFTSVVKRPDGELIVAFRRAPSRRAFGEKEDTHVDPNSYLVRSTDGGKTWQGPIYLPNISPEINYTPFGDGIPAYNRGALYEGKSGRIFSITLIF